VAAIARLSIVSGPEDGREIRAVLPAVFGRLPDCEVPIPYDWLASRRHARLSIAGTSFVLEDLGSRNGTFLLTGEPVRESRPIATGELFRVGGVWFRLAGTIVASPAEEAAAEQQREG